MKEDLYKIEWDDHLQGKFEHAANFSERIDYLLLSKGAEDERARRQIDLIYRIRDILEKYSMSEVSESEEV